MSRSLRLRIECEEERDRKGAENYFTREFRIYVDTVKIIKVWK